MDYFQEQLSCPRVEYEYSPIDGFGGQVALKGFVDSHSIDIGVIYKPNGLIAE